MRLTFIGPDEAREVAVTAGPVPTYVTVRCGESFEVEDTEVAAALLAQASFKRAKAAPSGGEK
jgi:hypothetical protein